MENVFEITTGEAIPAEMLTDSDPVRIYAERYLKSPWRFPDKYTGSPTITLAVITQNSEQSIACCLDSVKGVVDEIIVVDTGSTDRTVDIVQGYSAKVISGEGQDSQADARGLALEHATGDWVMFLEADEELVQQDSTLLREVLEYTESESFFFSEFSQVGDSADGLAINLALRLYKNRLRQQEELIDEKLQARIQATNPAVVAAIGIAPAQIRRIEHLDSAARQSNIEQNIKRLQKEAEADPDNPYIQCSLGAEYLRLKDYEEAFEAYRQAFANLSEINKSFASNLIRNSALCLKELGRYQEALEVLHDARDNYPDCVDLLYIEGQLNLELKDYGSAVSCFNSCLDIDPASTDYPSQAGAGGHLAAYMLAKAHTALRNDAGAIAAYRRSLEHNPKYRLALLELGLMLVRRQSASELKQFLEPIVDLSCKEMLVALALIFSQGAYYREALDYLYMLESLDGESPDSSQVAILRGECLLNLGQYRKAIIALNEVAWSSEHFVTATIDKALCYFLLGEHSGAVRSLDLIRGRSGFKLVYSVYHSLISLIGEEQVALAVDDEQKDEALNLVADVMRKLLELKEFEACEKAVVLLKDLGLESGEINLFLGKIYYDAGQNGAAVERLIVSYESGYADGEAFFILGQTSLNEEFFDEAKIFFYEALNNGIEEYALYISLARTLIQLGESQEALDVLNTGEKKYPDAPLIAEIKRSIGDKV